MPAPSQSARLVRSPTSRRVLRWVVMLLVLGIVVWFAGDTLRQGWIQLSDAKLRIRWSWAVLSGLLYIGGLAPMMLYWRRALRSLGQAPRPVAVVRAYYLGHLGKYVPGKALVAALRTGALVAEGCDLRRVLVTVFLETLTFMATGGAIAAGLLMVSSDEAGAHRAILAAGLALASGLPVTPPIARRLAARVIAGRGGEGRGSADALAGITWSLTAWGIASALVTWTALGLSLWATLRAIGVDDAAPLSQLALWVEAVTLPVVAGFLSLIPGGLLVRDALQVELLTATIPAEVALVATALWRLISVASEVITCVILEASRLYRTPSPPRDDTL